MAKTNSTPNSTPKPTSTPELVEVKTERIQPPDGAYSNKNAPSLAHSWAESTAERRPSGATPSFKVETWPCRSGNMFVQVTFYLTAEQSQKPEWTPASITQRLREHLLLAPWKDRVEKLEKKLEDATYEKRSRMPYPMLSPCMRW